MLLFVVDDGVTIVLRFILSSDFYYKQKDLYLDSVEIKIYKLSSAFAEIFKKIIELFVTKFELEPKVGSLYYSVTQNHLFKKCIRLKKILNYVY